MQKEAKLTAKDIAYYKAPAKGVKFTGADAEKVDSDRLETISKWSDQDVYGKKQIRDKHYFKNDAEYRYYLLGLYETADRIELGLD